MSNESRKRLAAQFIQFNLVGLLNTAIDFLLFALLTWLGVYYLLAQATAYAAGMLNSLLLNSRFTFRKTDGSRTSGSLNWKTGVRFIIWNLIVLGQSLLLLAALTEWLSFGSVSSKLLVTAVTAGINFYGSKRWVFAARAAG
ncbi:GtrA family protein [Paenibacillus harenae]|uniref:GtrA family protein n=1 Tax=Paenibacillus harenae TaxID=306543 RepID=UPI0004159C9B|nr:GtrA family protein [Paenibacillus harenae]